MNIAISRIMVVEAGGQIFGIPMDAVTETVRLTPDRISRIKNNDGFVLRDRIVPICSLAELMNLPEARRPALDARLSVLTDIGGKIDRAGNRRHPRSSRSGAQAASGLAVQCTRIFRHDAVGRWPGPVGSGFEGDFAMSVRRRRAATIVLRRAIARSRMPSLCCNSCKRAPRRSLVTGRQCSHLHTAVLQVILAGRTAIDRPLRGSWVERWVASNPL